jgi:uncharacterized membrane protein
MPQSYPSSSSSRLLYLDWTRGLAAAIMLQGHVFHSFTRTDLRTESPFMLSQFVGGMPPALFLFLTGVTLAFLMSSRERLGWSAPRRIWSGLRRAGYLVGVAFLVRVQLWLFAQPYSPWQDLVKVDILNCMGVAVALFSLMALFPAPERVRLCGALGLGIAALSPLVSNLDWSGAPQLLRNYIAPSHDFFSFFPWAAFVAFGMSFGSLIKSVPPLQIPRAMQWVALCGIVLIAATRWLCELPYSLYPKADFWLDSPALILIKLGVVMLILSAAYLWTEYGSSGGWSWLRQLGTTSLLVYWVHIELVYGRLLGSWKDSLSTAETVAVAVAVTVLMLGLSVIRTQWKTWKVSVPVALDYYFSTARRVSGD